MISNQQRIKQYHNHVAAIHKELKKLKKLMDDPAFGEMINDPTMEEDIAGGIYGDHHSFVKDLAETY